MNREEMLRELQVGKDNGKDMKELALELSIRKWREIEEGSGEDNGRENCALCETFPGCVGCHVHTKTKRIDCEGTPYQLYCRLKRHTSVDTSEMKVATMVERKFLESLRPRAKKEKKRDVKKPV